MHWIADGVLDSGFALLAAEKLRITSLSTEGGNAYLLSSSVSTPSPHLSYD